MQPQQQRLRPVRRTRKTKRADGLADAQTHMQLFSESSDWTRRRGVHQTTTTQRGGDKRGRESDRRHPSHNNNTEPNGDGTHLFVSLVGACVVAGVSKLKHASIHNPQIEHPHPPIPISRPKWCFKHEILSRTKCALRLARDRIDYASTSPHADANKPLAWAHTTKRTHFDSINVCSALALSLSLSLAGDDVKLNSPHKVYNFACAQQHANGGQRQCEMHTWQFTSSTSQRETHIHNTPAPVVAAQQARLFTWKAT